MAVNEHDALPGQFIRHLHGNVGVAAGVVSDDKGDFLAIDATILINVAYRQLGAPLQLLSEGGEVMGETLMGPTTATLISARKRPVPKAVRSAIMAKLRRK